MAMVFLDIGAHWGETLDEVLSDRWRFDRVLAIEPDPVSVAELRKRFGDPPHDRRLTICPFGLSDQDGEATLYGASDGGGASLFSDKRGLDPEQQRTVPLRQASHFLSEMVAPDDVCVAKMNCEGAEVAILDDWRRSGLLDRLAAVMVDFDIVKVRGRRGEAAKTRRALREAGFNRLQECDDVMIGTDHQARIQNWLAGLDIVERIATEPTRMRSIVRHAPLRRRVAKLLRA